MPSDISQKFNDSFIVLDKPKGPTSHQVDFWVREITGISRVGHVGTLDPGVTGVLVMATGKAVKLIDIIHEQPKEYICVMRLYHDIGMDRVREVFQEFTGTIYQIPPMRSAVSRTLREREIYEMEILESADKLVLFRVKCQSGTYIRTLCTDIGYALGVGAQMAELRRTSTGMFSENTGMITLQDLKDAVTLMKQGNSVNLDKGIFPLDYPMRAYPKIVVKDSSLKNISMGSDLFPGGIRAVLGKPRKGNRVAVYSEKNELVGTGMMLTDYDSITDLKVVDFDRIMISPLPERITHRTDEINTPGERPAGRTASYQHRSDPARNHFRKEETRRPGPGSSGGRTGIGHDNRGRQKWQKRQKRKR